MNSSRLPVDLYIYPQTSSLPEPASSSGSNRTQITADQFVSGISGFYEGEVIENKLHGRGKLIYTNGNFVEGKLQGKGKYKSERGGIYIYEGEFVNGLKYGKGKLEFNDKATFIHKRAQCDYDAMKAQRGPR